VSLQVPSPELSSLEQECVDRLTSTGEVFGIETERLGNGTLLIVGWHAAREAFVALFAMAAIPVQDTLDELYDWCQSQLTDYRRRDSARLIAQGVERESVDDADQFPWYMGLAYPGEGVVYERAEENSVTHDQGQGWTVEFHLIPREALDGDSET
jgi:hypothetical protein